MNEPEQFDRLSFLPGEEMQVDYVEADSEFARYALADADDRGRLLKGWVAADLLVLDDLFLARRISEHVFKPQRHRVCPWGRPCKGLKAFCKYGAMGMRLSLGVLCCCLVAVTSRTRPNGHDEDGAFSCHPFHVAQRAVRNACTGIDAPWREAWIFCS